MASYLLLDGHSLAYRAWFALQDAGMANSSGQQTQAVYGFVSMVTKLLDDQHPDGVGVAFDLHGPTFRDAIVDDYKAGRPPTPDQLITQIELIREFVDALGVPRLEAEGFEADDVLATVSTDLSAQGHDVIIVTGDRDSFQLVHDPHVRVLYNRRGVSDYALYDEAGIEERTGVRPVDYPFLAALRGDPSDNIVGVPGVGEKTAAKLVTTYKDVDALFAHLDECTPKLRENLAANEVHVRRNLELTPLRHDAPVHPDVESLALGHEHRDELDQLFALLEMRTPRERLYAVLDKVALSGTASSATSTEPHEAVAVTTLASADEAVAFIVALDRSTSDGGRFVLEPRWASTPGRSAIEGIALGAIGSAEIGYLEGDCLGEEAVADALASLVALPRRLVAHRSKELMRALGPEGIDVTGLDLDTAVVGYLVDPQDGQITLAELAERYGLVLAAAGAQGAGQLGFDLAEETPVAGQEVAERAVVLGALAQKLDARLAEVGGVALWEEIERPLVRVLARMEIAGVAVDADRLRMINAELTEEAKRLEAEIQEAAGEAFNVNSTTQLRVILYEKLGLTPQRKTKTGYSTDAATLEKLRDAHPVVDALLRYREVEKLRSTYGEGLLSEIAPDGRIHASFNQTVARTGRLSSDAPNLHNIPVRTEEGRRFRTAFIPSPGAELLVADYNQIELRVIAHLARDPGLVSAFEEGRDIHNATAVGIYGVEPDEVTSAMRSKAKMVSYGLAYGMEAYGLAQRLAIPVDEANEILSQYFVAFPAVRAFMDHTVVEARKRGYTETERGRRRYLPDLTSDNYRVRQAAERQAMNAPTQGLAADIFKLALVHLDAALEEADLGARLVLQVHDEVIVEVPVAAKETVEPIVRDAMTQAYPLSVPLEVHLAWGTTWGDAKSG
jgi:DNA polymerase I